MYRHESQPVHSISSSNNLYGCFSTETKSHQKLSLFYDTAQYNNRQNVAIKMKNIKKIIIIKQQQQQNPKENLVSSLKKKN